MKKIQLILSILILSATTFAGEFANLNFIGFSKDGKYLAFEDSGEWDISGQNFSNTYFIDVEKNSYVFPPVKIDDFAETEAAEKAFAPRDRKLRAKIAENLRKLKIVKGNYGQLVVSHLLTDWTSAKTSQQKFADEVKTNYDEAFFWREDGGSEKVIFNDYINPNSPNTFQFYELTLKQILVQTGDSPHSGGTYKIELTLEDKTRQQKVEPQILQKDDVLPKVRDFPYGYRIERVYLKDDKIAVFINVYNYGFEGISMRYMVVTGKFRSEDSNK